MERLEPTAQTATISEFDEKQMILNMGPSHPAMHGTVRIRLWIEGETIVKSDVEIGYLHRAFEKMSENSQYTQVIPYTDRLNYVSPILNNVGYALAVEKLLQIEVPERCQYIRVIMGELSRIGDHLTCIGASAMELGGFTPFLYAIKARDFLWDLVEKVCGARLTTSYTRIGGVSHDLPEGFEAETKAVLEKTREAIREMDKLLQRNRIFYDRMHGVGVISAEEAIDYGFTG
ncbi:MAG: NADH-quinone oxidoreductase subunit D, partial [Deltaproteobacteria bacterium]